MSSSLFIPTTRVALQPFRGSELVKGQLYNLDLNEFIDFQFNPKSLKWYRVTNWADSSWIGDDAGGDLSYINTGARMMDLTLVFVNEPGAPPLKYDVRESLSNASDTVDFQELRRTIERWESLVTGKGRPSRVRIIVGPNTFDCVILRSEFEITDFFEDLTAREATIGLEFREWVPLST